LLFLLIRYSLTLNLNQFRNTVAPEPSAESSFFLYNTHFSAVFANSCLCPLTRRAIQTCCRYEIFSLRIVHRVEFAKDHSSLCSMPYAVRAYANLSAMPCDLNKIIRRLFIGMSLFESNGDCVNKFLLTHHLNPELGNTLFF